MFCVVYSFKVLPGKDQDLIDSWTNLTKLIYQYEGSLGSRLHRTPDGSYIAYAQWPSRERWKESGDNLPEEATHASKRMREACSEISTLYELDPVQDLIQSKTNN